MDSIIADELALRRVALRGERAAVQKLFDDQKISKTAFLIASAKLQRLENRMIRSVGRKVKLGHGTARNFIKLRNRVSFPQALSGFGDHFPPPSFPESSRTRRRPLLSSLKSGSEGSSSKSIPRDSA